MGCEPGSPSCSPRDCHTGCLEKAGSCDNGPGIPPELLARVCEPFFSTHRDEGLRGLGLAIVQDIVKIHGGRIEMKSSPYDGTQIVLYFPIVQNVTSMEINHEDPSLNKP